MHWFLTLFFVRSYVVHCDQISCCVSWLLGCSVWLNPWFSLEFRILSSYFSKSWPFFFTWWLVAAILPHFFQSPSFTELFYWILVMCITAICRWTFHVKTSIFEHLTPAVRMEGDSRGAAKISVKVIDFKLMHVLMQALPLTSHM